MLFLTAGDQPLSELPAILDALVEGGADVIEVGIPFSDPFGEGPTIQASSQRSLDNGTTPSAILDALSLWRGQVPVVTMGYYNPVLRSGLSAFALASEEAGASGTIICDLIPDESTLGVRQARLPTSTPSSWSHPRAPPGASRKWRSERQGLFMPFHARASRVRRTRFHPMCKLSLRESGR